MPNIALEPVDHVEVLSIMDNSIDALMASTPVAQRAPLTRDKFSRPQLRAEHGVSMLITVESQGRKDSILFDAGVSTDGALHNMEVLGIRPNELHATVLSHGHTDHTLGLIGMLKKLGRTGMPIILHPDAFLNRKNVLPDGHEVNLPPPRRRDIEAEGITVVEEKGPTLLIDGRVLITGEIPRTTPFEKGFPPGHAEIEGKWQPDPWIHDDQAMVINVRDKGLVVLTGCGHAGLINTLKHSTHTTGVRDLYAVIGGFHLTGSLFEPIIDPTIKALKEFSPKVIVPQHCTGWRAIFEITKEFPEAYVPNSVGTRFTL
ncbi:MAG: MBL fold metallo-hydrolase [Deltaproteobacteria bacterium]|nr:MBL fold metallo-hydrolase [Deltaproteobacteria bacterium]